MALNKNVQTPYHLLAVSVATSILRERCWYEDNIAQQQMWVNLTEKDYRIESIRWLEENGYQAEIKFETPLITKTVTVPFQTVTLHQFISYIAVRQALEKPHAKLFTETSLRRAGTDIECVVPYGHDFNNGFHHNDWYFPPEMFIMKDSTLLFHSPVIQGIARIVYYTPD